MERSVYSENACFLENTREMGGISDVEYSLLGRWFRFMTGQMGDRIRPDLIGKAFS